MRHIAPMMPDNPAVNSLTATAQPSSAPGQRSPAPASPDRDAPAPTPAAGPVPAEPAIGEAAALPLPRLSLAGIRKAWPAVLANDDVSLEVAPGEIHAILGENGAGKSTLVKIIYGVIQADAGSIVWEGRPVQIASPAVARGLGIGMVFQHFSLFETLTVTENIALGLGERTALNRLADRILETSRRFGLEVDPRRHIHELSVGERQRVEIVRCLLQSPRLLIMDEPTSVLPPQLVAPLFETLRRIAAEGCSVLYISHKLEEIRALCDRATVMRGGRVVASCRPAERSARELAEMMIGRELPSIHRSERAAEAVALLRVRSLTLPAEHRFGTRLQSIDLEVRGGEIVGIAGISGNGQRELLDALSGESLATHADTIELCGQPVGRIGAARRRALGLATVVEERLGRGAVPMMSLARNALLTAHRQALVRTGLIDSRALRQFTLRCIERFSVRCSGPEAAAGSLSGGNLQRFIVGRELLQSPRVLLIAQPTWGVDVGAAAFIRQSLLDLRDRGAAVLVISDDLDELLEISDRIAVLAGGRLASARPVAQTSAAEIGLLMAGA
jgi:simple sugar transport system ATP-binding protein